MYSCSLCGSSLRAVVSSKDAKSGQELIVKLCETCGLVQQAVIPSEEELRVYYSHHYRKDYKKTYAPKSKYVYRAGLAARNRLAFLGDVLNGNLRNPPVRMLDVGAGGGEVVYAAVKKGLEAKGIEPNLGYSDFAREQYGITIETKHLDQVDDGPFDLITMFHVLEHIPNPAKVMRRLAELIQPGGFLMIEVPNIQQADASPSNIYFKAHLFYFAAPTLRAFASPYFDPVKIDDSGNLKVLFRRRPSDGNLCLPTLQEVNTIKNRLKEKGWLEYLVKGGGWKRPIKRVAQLFNELKIKKLTPRQTLDSLIG